MTDTPSPNSSPRRGPTALVTPMRRVLRIGLLASLVALLTAGMDATALGASVLGSWLVKMVLLLVVLALLRDADFYSRPVLFLSLLVGTIGTLVLEALVVTRTQVPYTESPPR
jgi:hypothetical protein